MNLKSSPTEKVFKRVAMITDKRATEIVAGEGSNEMLVVHDRIHPQSSRGGYFEDEAEAGPLLIGEINIITTVNKKMLAQRSIHHGGRIAMPWKGRLDNLKSDEVIVRTDDWRGKSKYQIVIKERNKKSSLRIR